MPPGRAGDRGEPPDGAGHRPDQVRQADAAVARLIARGEAEITKVTKAAGKGQQTYEAVRLRDEAHGGSP